MSNLGHFADAFRAYFDEAHLTYDELKDLTGVPRQTLVNWGNGTTRQPRSTTDLLRVAQALRLNELQATHLLETARHRSIEELLETATDPEERRLLQHWEEEVRRRVIQADAAPWYMPLDTLSDFTGRQSEFEQVIQLLSGGTRRCFIHGMAGVGKSALANQAARWLRRRFPDGVVWTQVGPPSAGAGGEHPELTQVMNALIELANAFNIDFKTVSDLDGRSRLLRGQLQTKQALLIIDDVQSADELTYLLPEPGTCSVIVTTRNKRITNPFKTETVSLKPFADDTAVALLRSIIGETRLASEGGSVDQELQDITRFVGGLPLALRVAGSTIRNSGDDLSLAEYCYHYLAVEPSRLKRLDDGSRHNNVLRVLDSAYRMLSPDEQFLFTVLGAFEGDDFTADAVAAAAAGPADQVATASAIAEKKVQLGNLVALSLLEKGAAAPSSDSPAPPQRYRLHALIRLLAREKLAVDYADQSAAIESRLANYFTDLCVTHESGRFGPIDQDWTNIRAAIDWHFRHGMWMEFLRGISALMAPSLGTLGYLDARGRWDDGARWSELAIDWAATIPDPQAQPELRFGRGVFAFRRSLFDDARQDLLLAQTELPEFGQRDSDFLIREAQCCQFLAELEMLAGNAAAALPWLDQAVAILHDLPGDTARHELGYTHVRRAATLGPLGRFQEMLPVLEEGLSLLPDYPTSARAAAYTNIGTLNAMQGNRTEAMDNWKHAVDDAQALGNLRRQADLHRNIAIMSAEHGDFAAAIEGHQQALDLYKQLGDALNQGFAASNLGLTLLENDQPEQARSYLLMALDIGDRFSLPPVQAQAGINLARWQIEQNDLEAAEESLERVAALGQDEIEAELYRLRAELWLQRGQLAEGLQAVEQSLEIVEPLGMAPEMGRCLRVKARLLAATGDVVAAAAAYREARDIFADNAFEVARIEAELADLSPGAPG